jgi:hypothetical protein
MAYRGQRSRICIPRRVESMTLFPLARFGPVFVRPARVLEPLTTPSVLIIRLKYASHVAPMERVSYKIVALARCTIKRKSRALAHRSINVFIPVSKLFLCSERDNNFSARYSRARAVSLTRTLQSLSGLSMSGWWVFRRVANVN